MGSSAQFVGKHSGQEEKQDVMWNRFISNIVSHITVIIVARNSIHLTQETFIFQETIRRLKNKIGSFCKKIIMNNFELK